MFMILSIVVVRSSSLCSITATSSFSVSDLTGRTLRYLGEAVTLYYKDWVSPVHQKFFQLSSPHIASRLTLSKLNVLPVYSALC